MLNVRLSNGEKGSDIYTFEKSSDGTQSILVLTKTVKGWTLEIPKTTILESSSDMRQIQELAEALSKVAQIVETEGYNKAGIKMLPARNLPQINTVGTAEKSAPSKKPKKAKN